MELDDTTKDKYFLYDPEEENPTEKTKNTKLFKTLDNFSKVRCIVTWKVGIRGLTYWKECLAVAWF